MDILVLISNPWIGYEFEAGFDEKMEPKNGNSLCVLS
jgi:hypothetical protein